MIYISGIETTFTDFKYPMLRVAFPSCTFKCCKEFGMDVKNCHNHELTEYAPIGFDTNNISQYFDVMIHKGIVFGGLEPFDTFSDMMELMVAIDKTLPTMPIVIYTGYYPNEIEYKLRRLTQDFSHLPIIVKFGRYNPNLPKKFDDLLGVELASENQFATIF